MLWTCCAGADIAAAQCQFGCLTESGVRKIYKRKHLRSLTSNGHKSALRNKRGDSMQPPGSLRLSRSVGPATEGPACRDTHANSSTASFFVSLLLLPACRVPCLLKTWEEDSGVCIHWRTEGPASSNAAAFRSRVAKPLVDKAVSRNAVSLQDREESRDGGGASVAAPLSQDSPSPLQEPPKSYPHPRLQDFPG